MELNYYYRYYQDHWQTVIKDCNRCSFRNRLGECGTEVFSDLEELLCNNCGDKIAAVVFPTQEELKEAGLAGNKDALLDYAFYYLLNKS